MNKARERVKKEFKNGEGVRSHQNPAWYWRLRSIVEIIWYWINAFRFPISILIWIATGDYWKGLAFLAVGFLFDNAANLRGLYIHAEHLIEWTIKETV